MEMIYLKIIAALLRPICTVLLKPALFNLSETIKRRKLRKAISSRKRIAEFDSKFTGKFLDPYLKGLEFELLSGISTNPNSIAKYKKFIDRLGADYTWPLISKVKEAGYTYVGEEEVSIIFPIVEKYAMWLLEILIVLLFLFSAVTLFTFSIESISPGSFLTAVSIVSLPATSAIVLLYLTEPMRLAYNMSKSLGLKAIR